MNVIPPGPERRRHLEFHANPASGRDYLVTLQARMSDGRTVTLSYVPDRAVAEPESFAKYVEALEILAWPCLEHLGAAMLEDLANVLVPRWACIELMAETRHPLQHRVRLEERQPQWRNDALVSGA